MQITFEEYPDGSFDIVLDKGALDALLSDNNTTDSIPKAKAMFDEISRVLNTNGKYICITLVESHICRSLLSYFSSSGSRGHSWSITVEAVANKKLSPFKTFFIVMTKNGNESFIEQTGGLGIGNIDLYIDRFGNDMALKRSLSLDATIDEVRLRWS